MKIRAEAKYIRQAPNKVRIVLEHVRGLPAIEAQQMLAFTDRRASEPISKVLNSAIANAENNFGFDADELVVFEAFADEGPTLKRFRPRARGRATPIHKRTSHITIILSDNEED